MDWHFKYWHWVNIWKKSQEKAKQKLKFRCFWENVREKSIEMQTRISLIECYSRSWTFTKFGLIAYFDMHATQFQKKWNAFIQNSWSDKFRFCLSIFLHFFSVFSKILCRDCGLRVCTHSAFFKSLYINVKRYIKRCVFFSILSIGINSESENMNLRPKSQNWKS